MKSIAGFIMLVVLSQSGSSQWTRIGYPGKWISALYVMGDTVLTGYRYYVFRSINHGEQWDTLVQTSTIEVSGFHRFGDTLLVSTNRDRACPAGLCNPLPSIFKSIDQGKTWNSILDAVYGVKSIVRTSRALYANPDGQLVRSTDNGVTWSRVVSDSVIVRAAGFVNGVFAKGDTLCIAGASKGFYRSLNNGSTWEGLGNGLP